MPTYSGEFKQKVIEDLRKNHLSYNETMSKYKIAGKMTIQKWERIYLEEGPEGLYIERRGQANEASGTRKGGKQDLDKQVSEDLIPTVHILMNSMKYRALWETIGKILSIQPEYF